MHSEIGVLLASGRIERLEVCPRCEKPIITLAEERELRAEKVELGRCRCPRSVAS